MPKISVRLTATDEVKLNTAAKKAGIALSEYIRRILFQDNTVAKIDFYTNIDKQLQKFAKQSFLTNQLLCQVLLNQTDAATVQIIIQTIKNEMEENYND